MSRCYTIEGHELPSVTTVLKLLDKGDVITQWAVRKALEYVKAHRNDTTGEPAQRVSLDGLLNSAATNWRSVLSEAADIGSAIHHAIESYIKTGTMLLPHDAPQVMNGFAAFLQWEKEHGIKWIQTEMVVYDLDLCYGGTLDAICVFEGRPYVIDFKSSAGFYDEHPLQIAAYRAAAVKMGHAVEGCGILRLDKTTGQPEWRDFSKKYERSRKTWEALLTTFYLHKNRQFENNPRAELIYEMFREPKKAKVAASTATIQANA